MAVKSHHEDTSGGRKMEEKSMRREMKGGTAYLLNNVHKGLKSNLEPNLLTVSLTLKNSESYLEETLPKITPSQLKEKCRFENFFFTKHSQGK